MDSRVPHSFDLLGGSPRPPGDEPSPPHLRTPWWARIPLPAIAGALIFALALGFALGRVTAPDTQAPGASPEPMASPTTGIVTPETEAPTPSLTTPSPTPTYAAPIPIPEPSATPSAAPSAEGGATELALLAGLDIKGRAPMTGYSRDEFGEAWFDVDGNGCDTRNDILTRDLTDITYRSNGCLVSTGVLNDPYTGATIDFVRGWETSILVQIDHVVPLADAWAKGAQKWSYEKRIQFANDPLNLLAVDGPQNQAKGAGDAATWLPPARSYWCDYATRIVQVKDRYDIWVTRAEYEQLNQILLTCR